MKRYKYLQLHMSDITEDIQKHYNLHEKATTNGYIHVEMQKDMYGLLQAGD